MLVILELRVVPAEEVLRVGPVDGNDQLRQKVMQGLRSTHYFGVVRDDIQRFDQVPEPVAYQLGVEVRVIEG